MTHFLKSCCPLLHVSNLELDFGDVNSLAQDLKATSATPVLELFVEFTGRDTVEVAAATEVLRDPAVAVKLAACLLAAGDAWLKSPQAGELSKEQLELRDLVPEVLQSASALSDTLKGNQVLADFQQLLKR
ncbi:hypothetical protein AK812_SmicGene4702 [Symbiodinium microadriaticum]|uniref:Uncharacterized protein n=1 Tax=Symbiodinium microadriaticum TaxID=2951 RepID=A0A1Q9EVI5_SYMMI|nr:hypothetical protein AK812_SmicGene4702 [Symbiodinium microadriaticum]